MTEEIEQLKQFERFNLDTKAAKAEIAARDEIKNRLDDTRRSLGALRPDKVKDFTAESSRLSNLLAGLDLALTGAGEDIETELDALRLKALEAPHLNNLSEQLRAADVAIIEKMLPLPDMLHKRMIISDEFALLRDLQKAWSGELGIEAGGEQYNRLPGGGRQGRDGNQTLKLFFDRFLQVCGSGMRPGAEASADDKLRWFVRR
jgi:hypothetical protein